MLGWQSRFRWIVKPGNDLYFVWFDNWVETESRWTDVGRSAALKAVYTYGF